MNAIAVPFRQLVERRLWPLAALLIAALVAVPVLLSKGAAPTATTPMATTSGAQGSTEPIVSVSDPAQSESVRKVLGSRKNPFRPAISAVKGKPVEAVQAPSQGGSSDKTDSAGSTGGAGAAPAMPTTPMPGLSPVVTPAPVKTYELYSLKVRFGTSSSDDLPARTLKRLKALPSNEDAALIYLGLLKDHKTAVFLVDGGAKVQGDGRCYPSQADCQTLQLKRGDTAFVDMPGAEGAAGVQYQLDLVKIRTTETTDAEAAKRSYAAESKGGRAALRARLSRTASLRFDPRTGTLRKQASE